MPALWRQRSSVEFEAEDGVGELRLLVCTWNVGNKMPKKGELHH